MRIVGLVALAAVALGAGAASGQGPGPGPRGYQDPPITGPVVPELGGLDRFLRAFVIQHRVPGLAVAVAHRGRVVYARGFGLADVDAGTPVEPDSLFRIASVSKPITAVAVLRLVEHGKLKLDDPAFKVLDLRVDGKPVPLADPRLGEVTVRELLRHTGGWDGERSGDPMFRPVEIARELGVPPPAAPAAIVRAMLGKPLDFDPGHRYAYSNFGYCVLGRLIEKVSGKPYETFVRAEVLAPLGIRNMRLGKTLPEDRAPREVRYYDAKRREGPGVVGPTLGKRVPLPYGGFDLEAIDAHGGWLASAEELVRFAAAFDDPRHPRPLHPRTLAAMVERPEGLAGFRHDGNPRDAYYGLGWMVRPVGPRGDTLWHSGRLDGTSALLVRRFDGTSWAVLFNTDADPQGQDLAETIDPLLHPVIDTIRSWPSHELLHRHARDRAGGRATGTR
ncbi:MAG TPA: serine hydrolase domain-containing protein [Isosphaeraceae bacterium]|jgi:N-acyl-D-amino-acid deacylase|nr:serine hydrolase domain-containing protein [Isosphaeraceae bacterium]